ncbi:MAG TPA: amidohydrolase family protein [Gammaproteobacteria bacterium]
MSEIRHSGPGPALNRRRLIAAGAAIGLHALAGTAAAQRSPSEVIAGALTAPDLALINGRFVDYRGVVGDTLLLANGRIRSVGSNIGPGPAVPTVDLGGRTAIPGFVDAHVHYTRAGVNPGHQERRVERAFSIAELQETIAARAASVPRGEFITCIGGWNPLQFRESRRPTRAELDAAAPDHAVYLSATGRGAGAVTNGRVVHAAAPFV